MSKHFTNENCETVDISITNGTEITDLTAQLNKICEQAEAQDHAVIVLRAISNSFCLNSWLPKVTIKDVNRWERALRQFERITATSVMVVSGLITGPLFDLLLATDYRIAAPDLHLQIPANEGHFWPGMLIYRLVSQLGFGRARQLVMAAQELTAKRALDIGLIDEISEVTSDAVNAAVKRFAPISREFSIGRQLMLEASMTTFEDALGTHLAACDRELRRRNLQNENA